MMTVRVERNLGDDSKGRLETYLAGRIGIICCSII